MPYARTVDNSADVLDIREVIERFEELESDCEDYDPKSDSEQPEDWDEYNNLKAFIDECKGNGGDHQWRGDWYPVGLIRDSYFKEYAQELAEDIGAIAKDATWPNNYIDWDSAADALQGDYTSVEFNGVTYWVR